MPNAVDYQGFVGSAYRPQSGNVDNQILRNWYLERSESPDAKTPNALYPCPGFETFCTLPKSPIRGLFSQNAQTFAVADDALYELFADGTFTARAFTTLTDPSAPTITNSPPTPALPAPSVPVVTHGGTLGATTYGYKITALNSLGETEASVEGTSPYGNATLSATNYNVVSWSSVASSTGYNIYRTTGGVAPPKLIGSVSNAVNQFQDIGTAGTAVTPPAVNTTGGTAGATTYGYKVTATLGLGETAASAEGVTLTGQATLDEDNYNIVTWVAVPLAGGYNIYRTTGGASPPVLIGTVTSDTLSFNDVGEEGESLTPPIGNTTGTDTLVNDGSIVSMCSSGDAGQQLLIVSAGAAYVFDLEYNTLAKVVEGATIGGYIATYFVVLDAATSTLKVSESLDGFSWDGGQVYQRVLAGDRWLSMIVTNAEIWLLGSQTTEIWVGTGDNETRFAPMSGVFIEQGVMATATALRLDTTQVWLGQNVNGAGIVWRTNGYTPVQISTRTVERALQGFTTLADATAWTYQEDGHSFYVLTFPTDEATWVYDLLTNEWHERGFWNPDNMAFTVYRPQCHTMAFGGLGFGKHLVGDRASGVVATMDVDIATDFDDTYIRRERQAPHVASQNRQIKYSGFELEFERGDGTATGQGSDPTIMIRWSDNGGRSFGNEVWRSAGRQGETSIRVRIDKFGMGRDRVTHLVVTDPIPWRIAGAYFVPSGGAS